jgi:ArsR family transcriptional regulator, arsenate/arsenite/antimonite-responsive transcriptional repressor
MVYIGMPETIDEKRLARVFRALSNPNRLKLYLMIAEKSEESFSTDHECFITDIIETLPIGAPTISHHLKELEDAGLISTERRGKYLVARVNSAIAGEVGRMLSVVPKK